ncbi:hypothetical protein NJF54_20150 [Pseudomonas guariconensis]|uniref:hypothetical protein n=1 Tax=Pseudomonas guariconensis TaxID=1288410 RepID=UPI00209AB790|nr:hypothetical protein [Pseudomonas guariconensis]MCO7634138.1 hypothetical protein [Pseudomonas guariconensis]
MKTIDQRLAILEQATNTTGSLTVNALGALARAITRLDSVDRQALWDDLQALKDVHIQNGNQDQYHQMISIIQSNIA